MNNHKSVQVVMLPTHKSALAIKDSNNKLEIAEQNASFINGIGYTPQHLCFTSNEEIKEGDIAVYNGELYHINTHHKGVTYKGKNATSGGGRTEYNYYTVLNMSKRTSSTEIIHYPYSRRFKPVVACSDPSLGLPAIPTTWIRDVYVPSNGSIKEVKLKIDEDFNDWYERMELKSYPYYKLELTPNNEVVIVDEPIISSENGEHIMQRLKDMKIKFQQKLDAKTDSLKVDQELEDAAKDHADNWWDSEPDPETDKHFTEEFNEAKKKWAKHDFICGFEQGANWKAEQQAKEIESRTEVIKEYQKTIDQSANDAMSFVEWVHKQHYEIPNSNTPITWTNEGHRWPPNNIYTTQELYELWQQNR